MKLVTTIATLAWLASACASSVPVYRDRQAQAVYRDMIAAAEHHTKHEGAFKRHLQGAGTNTYTRSYNPGVYEPGEYGGIDYGARYGGYGSGTITTTYGGGGEATFGFGTYYGGAYYDYPDDRNTQINYGPSYTPIKGWPRYRQPSPFRACSTNRYYPPGENIYGEHYTSGCRGY